jgi:hypothetical protein
LRGVGRSIEGFRLLSSKQALLLLAVGRCELRGGCGWTVCQRGVWRARPRHVSYESLEVLRVLCDISILDCTYFTASLGG